MKLKKIKGLSGAQFRRLTGVKFKTFDRMVQIVKEAHREKKKYGGRPNKLTVEDMILMTLEYFREYRTYLQIERSYGLSESNVFECILWVENVLIRKAKRGL